MSPDGLLGRMPVSTLRSLNLQVRRLAMACCGACLAAGAGCAFGPADVHSVLIVDACSTVPILEPLDLTKASQAAGCDGVGLTGYLVLTVESVVSPIELVIRSCYGVERVRPAFEAATFDRLQHLGRRRSELNARIAAKLLGRQFLEPNARGAPPVTATGLRLVTILSTDLEQLEDLVNSELDRLPEADAENEPDDSERIDLSRVRNAAELQSCVADAVAAAERWSPFRAPPDLTVEWAIWSELPPSSSSVYDVWRRQIGSCCDEDSGPDDEPWDPNNLGISIPGGRVFLKQDHDWRALELHFVLLHELMHQHQYALCAAGLMTRDVPRILIQAHASSLACDIVQREGASAASVAFVRERDSFSAATRAFDELRTGLGLSPDECLRYLVDHPDEARQLARELEWGWPIVGLGPESLGNRNLTFDVVPRSPGEKVIVTITNGSDEPFSGYNRGWWYMRTASSAGRDIGTGGRAFALRLPPHGSVTLETEVPPSWKDLLSCYAVFRRTPAPVFGMPVSAAEAGGR